MIDWEEQLSSWCGREAQVFVENIVNQDPIAPARTIVLSKVQYVPDRTYLKCYLNDKQYVSFPVFEQPQTRVEQDMEAGRMSLISIDREAQLVYQLHLI